MTPAHAESVATAPPPMIPAKPFDQAWFQSARRTGVSREVALQYFDTLAPVAIEEMLGRWRGYGFYTEHVMDGLLEEFGWFGKDFLDAETVQPLLFGPEGGKIVSINPATLPLAAATSVGFKGHRVARVAFDAARHLIETHDPVARLRMTEYRGVVSATCIYDSLPILDSFRRIDHAPDSLLGLMDYRGFEHPFFFVLERR